MEVDSVKHPTRASLRDGKVTGDGEMEEFKVLERVEEVFGKPEYGARLVSCHRPVCEPLSGEVGL